MSKSDKIYTGLCVLFAIVMVMGNLLYQKFLSIDFFSFYTFELGAGAILYPLTFFITDLIAEFYGKEKANFCVRLSVAANFIAVSMVMLIGAIPATSWSKISDDLFQQVFGLHGIAFLCSIVSCYVAQMIDVLLYLWIRKITKGKILWARSNGSTAISLFIDTCIVIGLLSLFGIIPAEQMWRLIGNSYMFKLFFTICSTPLFYLCCMIIKLSIKQKEQNNA